MPKNESQAILDFVLAFIAVVLLLLGIVRIWIWFDANYAHRQYAYQRSRLVAATPASQTNKPIDLNATESCPTCGNYKPLDLTEEWVFRGVPSGTVSGLAGEKGGIIVADLEIQCKQDALANDPSCKTVLGDGTEELNPNCAYYVKCLCNAKTKQVVDINNDQVKKIADQQKSLADSAATLRKQASKCDDPWEVCWWVSGFGRTSSELRDGARELDRANDKLGVAKTKIEKENQAMQACCNYDTKIQQDTCFTELTNRLKCEACMDADIKQLPYSNEECVQACTGTSSNCSENARNTADYLQSILDDPETGLRHKRDEINDILKQIATAISDCSRTYDSSYSTCLVECRAECSVSSFACGNCVNACQVRNIAARNDCCKSLNGWGRGCYQPAANCDEDCASSSMLPGCFNNCNNLYPKDKDKALLKSCYDDCLRLYCPKCSLATYAERRRKDLDGLNNDISTIEGYIKNLPACCDKPEGEQNDCIFKNSDLSWLSFMKKK